MAFRRRLSCLLQSSLCRWYPTSSISIPTATSSPLPPPISTYSCPPPQRYLLNAVVDYTTSSARGRSNGMDITSSARGRSSSVGAVGEVWRVIGSVVDVRFDYIIPPIYTALKVNNEAGWVVLKVVQLLGDNVVRCICKESTEGLAKGQHVKKIGSIIWPASPSSWRVFTSWTYTTRIGPVQGQGACGTCWAYSSLTTIEPLLALSAGFFIKLSVQDVIDNDLRSDGCCGGKAEYAFRYVTKYGVLYDNIFPATSCVGPAWKRNPGKGGHKSFKIDGYGIVPPNDEAALEKVLSRQPVVAAVDSSTFYGYESGILRGPLLGSRCMLDHAVVIVGHGTEYEDDGVGNILATDFWWVQNSWGSTWGEKGFIRIMKGGKLEEEGFSPCGLLLDLCYPKKNNLELPTLDFMFEWTTRNPSTKQFKGNANQPIALLCSGEMGRRKDLSASIMIESFQSPFEESAASYALGNIAAGNLSKYLLFILDQIDDEQKQYMLLHSLKEVIIVWQSVDKFQKSVDNILNILFNHSESDEEDVRNVVAECPGKIALVEPAKLAQLSVDGSEFQNSIFNVLSFMFNHCESEEDHVRNVVAQCLGKMALIELGKLVPALKHFKHAAVSALSAAACNKPNLIKGLLPELLPLLYDQIVVKKELTTTVDLGPSKHGAADGLELRKAAFECVDTLLDNCLDQVKPSSFIVSHLKSGLEDHYDVKMRCHSILLKLAERCLSMLLAAVDSLVDPLQKTISFKPKQNATKLVLDRNEDMMRCALHVIASLERISAGECSYKLKKLMNEIAKSPTMWGKYVSIRSK